MRLLADLDDEANPRPTAISNPNPLTTGSGSNFVAATGVTATYSRAGVLDRAWRAVSHHGTLAPRQEGLRTTRSPNTGASFTINRGLATLDDEREQQDLRRSRSQSADHGVSGSNSWLATGERATYSPSAGETVMGRPITSRPR